MEKYRRLSRKRRDASIHRSFFINFFRIDKLNSIPLCEVMFKLKFTWTCAWLAWSLILRSLKKIATAKTHCTAHWTTLEENRNVEEKRKNDAVDVCSMLQVKLLKINEFNERKKILNWIKLKADTFLRHVFSLKNERWSL